MSDPWRIEEWNALPDVCFIQGCGSLGTDPRGPVFLRRDGSMHKACTPHWEAVHRVLGEQVHRVLGEQALPGTEAPAGVVITESPRFEPVEGKSRA